MYISVMNKEKNDEILKQEFCFVLKYKTEKLKKCLFVCD